jgi:hypothetical protein
VATETEEKLAEAKRTKIEKEKTILKKTRALPPPLSL